MALPTSTRPAGALRASGLRDPMSKRSRPFLTAALTAAFLFLPSLPVRASEPPSREAALRDAYHRMKGRLGTGDFGFPLWVESSERDGRAAADIYGILEHPFQRVEDVLETPESWCDLASLIPNIKACTHQHVSGETLLTFYWGHKGYEPPEAAHRVTYRYRVAERGQTYLDLDLSADEGPLGTRDDWIRTEALPLPNGRTFVHVGYGYRYGFGLRLAQFFYFATAGRNKVGFTRTGTDRDGRPIYVRGPRGAVERGAARSYFAVQALLDSRNRPREERLGARLGEWYDLTSRYKPQLFDMEKDEYLAAKTREHQGQALLQRQVAMAATSVAAGD